MESTYLIVALGAIVAGFVQGLSGFAFGMVAMSFWAWSVEPHQAAAMAVFGALTGQIIAAFSVRRGFSIRTLLPYLLGGLAGIPLGLMILPMLDMRLFKGMLGILLIVWCPVLLFARHLPALRANNRFADSVIGLAGGIMSGIGGFSGAIPTLWCSLRRLPKDEQRNIIQNFNLTMLAVTMAGYLAAGIVTKDTLPMFAIVAPAMLIPTFLGTRLYIGISDAAFRNIVLSLLTFSGAAFLYSAIFHR